MHGSTMIYLFVTPMAIAMAMYLVPLQIGAVGLSGARLALAGMWTWLCGGLVMQQGWFASGGAGRDGWTSLAPLSNGTNTPGGGTGPVGDRRDPRGRGDDWLMAACVVGNGGAPAGARDVAAADAGVHLDGAGQRADGGGGVPDAGARDGPALRRPPRRRTSTRGLPARSTTRTCSGSSAIPVVYVMFFPYLGAAAEAIAVCCAQAVVRLHGVRRLDHGVRRAVDGRVVTPHVCDRRGHQPVLRVHLDAAAGAGRDRVLRRGRDADRRLDRAPHARCCSR